jgi:hypothetical protein
VSYIPPSPTPATPAPAKSNRTLWIILGSIGFVGVCSLLCVAIGVIGALTVLGRQTSTVFDEIESGLSAEPGFELPGPEPIDTSGALTVGASKRVGDLEFSVVRSEVVEDNTSNQSPDFYQFLAVRLRITNRGAEPFALEDVPFWSWLQDSDDLIYDCCIRDLSDSSMFDELAPGESVEGELVYEAPEEPEQLYWVYQGPTTSESVVVKLEQLTADSDVARMR